MSFLLWAHLFFIAGFFLESLVCVYHRSREYNRFVLAAVFSATITSVGILVSSRIVFSVIGTPLGLWSLFYIFFFAFGKGIGTYTSLNLWEKWHKDDNRRHRT